MSEYQYYECQAIDRPLTNKEMSELRSHSTRARITPTSFVNEYSWGSFKGDGDDWMERYFDAFLYFADWGTHILKLRLPSRLLATKTANEYSSGDSVSVKGKGDKVILSFVSENEDGDWDEDEGDLSSIISVRAELAQGDLRALYLGWLVCVQNGELDDQDVEPPVPPGLDQLSASLESLAEFLRIDRDLLQVGAQTSPWLSDAGVEQEDVWAWVVQLPVDRKDELVTNLLVDGNCTAVNELFQNFLKERSAVPIGALRPRRTVGQLLRAAEESIEKRRRIAAETRAEQKARRERETAREREKYLNNLASREPEVWEDVEKLIATKQPQKYDQAITLLVDLRDLGACGKSRDFGLRIEALRETHARKPSLIRRLKKAGL